MKIIFNHASLRARKARLNYKLGQKALLITCKVIIGLLLVVAGALLMSGMRVGSIVGVVAVVLLLLLLWQDGDLKHLPARLPKNDDELGLDQALDAELLALLPNNPNSTDIWKVVRHHWHWQFFKIRFGVDDYVIESGLAQVSAETIWVNALQLAKKHQLTAITPSVVVLALLFLSPQLSTILNMLSIEREDLEEGLEWLQHLEDVVEGARQKQHYGGLGRDWAAGYTPLLNQMAYNMSVDIERGGLWTRETEGHTQVTRQMLQILSKSQSASVALVGDLGVGKTTAVYALAKKLLTEKVSSLRYHKVFSLDASTLIANSSQYRSLEQLMLGIFNEASTAGNIIMFLDDAQLFMRAGTGSLDLTNVLLPVLQSGRVHLICAMTTQDWQMLLSTNSALAGLLNYQVMPPPTKPDALQIMQDQLITIEHKHGVVFMYQAIIEAYRLAEKYVHDQAFPGRGIKVLEETAIFGGGLITAEMVGKSLEAKLGVKVVQAGGAEKQQLLNLEDELHKRLINQVRAVGVVANALRRARSGVGNPNRPVGTFLFLGPTGVGKTELAKALADVYFGGREQIIRVNLNEFNSSSDVSRLLAATSAESSGSLLTSIRRQPYSVVLLDEIEKAHPEVLNVLLQLLDEGFIRDTKGQEASFKDAIVIATSNAGADTIRKKIEAGKNLEEFEEEFVSQLIDEKHFAPEFLNRFDEIVLFRPLKPEELQQVVQLMIDEVNQTLERQKVRVTLTNDALAWLVKKGDDPRLGARPMRRQVQRSVENIVAKKILSGQAAPGSVIALDVPDLEAPS